MEQRRRGDPIVETDEAVRSLNMIATLSDLICYTNANAQQDPWRRIAMHQQGCAPQAIQALLTGLPNIPQSYLSVVESVNLEGVEIGAFCLEPAGGTGADLAEKVIDWNNSVNPLINLLRRHGVYEVASWEADPIAIAYAEGLFRVGQTVLYNCGNFDENGDRQLL